MDDTSSTYSVVIAGGGPVGLLLGIMLVEAGISCLVLEKRAQPTSDSRSFGIHPPSLELLSTLGLAAPMIEEGLCIRRGYAFANTEEIGSLSFAACPQPFNFILSLPQNRTEQILEKHLNQFGDQHMIRGAHISGIHSVKADKVWVTYQQEGTEKTVEADYLVGCDGKDSFVRQWAQIPFVGQRYADTYAMGDFTDTTTFGTDAAIFLCDEGVIESFPLPHNQRRWVVKTTQYQKTGLRKTLVDTVERRIQHDLSGANHTMVSSFGVQKRLAQPMVKGRIILAGDAAHLVSPIGGQGMNLGWLSARDLADSLQKVITQQTDPQTTFNAFAKRRRKAFRNVARRSEINMRLGRNVAYPYLKKKIVSAMLTPPFSKLAARLFAMHGAERWII
jgi:2-polyprenyl-6-methoxyphenol hydroxylase-like FAD-dependent oxidoreductase